MRKEISGDKKMKNRHGFTLIELLVVVLIIGILSAIALPQYVRAVKRSRMAGVISTLKTIMHSGEIYVMHNSLAGSSSGLTSVNLDDFDITISNRRVDLKGVICEYSFSILPVGANAQYVATCTEVSTALGKNWLNKTTLLAQNTLREANKTVTNIRRTVYIAKNTVGSLHTVFNSSFEENLALLTSFSNFPSPLVALASPGGKPGDEPGDEPNPGSGSGSGSSSSSSTSSSNLLVGLTNHGDLFCTGSLCTEYGFSKVSTLSTSADLGSAFSGTLYTM